MRAALPLTIVKARHESRTACKYCRNNTTSDGQPRPVL